jgi:hypothetical protein
MGRKTFEIPQAVVKDKAVHISCLLSSDHKINEVFTVRRQIYRRTMNEFEYGVDYMEYFSGIASPEKSELIFEGVIPQETQRWCTYIDTRVEAGSVYAYWIRDAEEEAEYVGPLPVKVRNPDVFWSYGKILDRMQKLADKYPDIAEVKDFGVSTKNRPIRGIIAGNRSKLLGFAGIVHAGESGPELMIPALERLLEENRGILSKAGIAMLPCVNVDQREKHVAGFPAYMRVNPNGVDINRNFPAHWDDEVDYTYGLDTTAEWSTTYRGPFAASEAETRALMDFTLAVKPHAVFSFHSLGSICNDGFLLARAAKENKEYHKKAAVFFIPYSKGFRNIEGEDDLNMHYGCTAGSYPAWVYQELGIPCADLEFRDDEQYRFVLRDKTDQKAIEYYRNAHYRGILGVLETISDRYIE